MTLDEYFAIGETQEIGSQTLTAAEITAFASKYDPQPFHLSEEGAKGTVFGALCASGWHTTSLWMRYNLLHTRDAVKWTGEGPAPEFGPSPGFKNLRWLKPAYAGDTIRFTRISTGHRPLASRPGWRILSGLAQAYNGADELIMSFETAVLVKAH